jgi:hypothetical protein
MKYLLLTVIFSTQLSLNTFATKYEEIKDEREINRYHVAFQKLICDIEDKKIDSITNDAIKKQRVPDMKEAKEQFKQAFKLDGFLYLNDKKVSQAHSLFWDKDGLTLLQYRFGIDVENKPIIAQHERELWKNEEVKTLFKRVSEDPVLSLYKIPTVIFKKD